MLFLSSLYYYFILKSRYSQYAVLRDFKSVSVQMCKGFDALGSIYVHIFQNTQIYRSNFTWRILD